MELQREDRSVISESAITTRIVWLGRGCVLEITHYSPRKCTTVTLRAMHAITVSTRQRVPRNSRKHWTRHRVGALMHHHLGWCVTQRSNVTTTATQRHDHNNAMIEQVNTAVTESTAQRTKHCDREQKPRENRRASGDG